MTESRRELLKQLHDLERRADAVRQRLTDVDPSASTHPPLLDPQTVDVLQKLVIDHLSEALLVVGLDGVILDASRPARWMFNLRHRNLGHVKLETLAPDLLDQIGDDWSRRLLDEGAIGCSGRIDIGSARMEAEMLMVAVTELPRPIHCVLIRDVTAIRLEARTNEDLLQRLQEKHQELEAFTYRISHDLKSPLVSIGGFSKLVDEDVQRLRGLFDSLSRATADSSFTESQADVTGDEGSSSSDSVANSDSTRPEADTASERGGASLDPALLAQLHALGAEIQDHAVEIRRATHKAHGLIDQLLDLSRIAQSTVELAPQDIRSLVELSLKAHAPDLRDARVKVVVGKQLGTAWGDFQLLSSVFDNLLSNSIRFLRDVDQPTLTIKHRILDGQPIWFVEDNGPGIPEADRERVFDPFVRMDRVHKGSGVGLAIVRRIVEMHGGKVWVEPGEAGSGTRVVFSLAQQP
ncbi:MAG: HAMP domain-containing sensor histidine kinase [Pirellulaceae bacterium]